MEKPYDLYFCSIMEHLIKNSGKNDCEKINNFHTLKCEDC